MRAQDRDENEEKQEYPFLSEKDYMFWETIDRRNTFRALRIALGNLGIDLRVPMNLVDFTDEYCKKYGDPSIERMKTPPPSWKPHEN